MWLFERVRTSNELALFVSFEAYAAVLLCWNARPSILEAPLRRHENVWYALTFVLLVVWWLFDRRRTDTHRVDIATTTYATTS